MGKLHSKKKGGGEIAWFALKQDQSYILYQYSYTVQVVEYFMMNVLRQRFLNFSIPRPT